LKVGLVSEVVKDENLDSAALKFAKTMLEASPKVNSFLIL